MEVFDFKTLPTENDIIIYKKGKWILTNKYNITLEVEKKIKELNKQVDELNKALKVLTCENENLKNEINTKLASYHDVLKTIVNKGVL